MMQCHALKSPLARIEGTIDTVVFADGVVREDIVLVSNPITIGLNTDEQQSVVRYDMVERSSGLTIKTYTNPAVVFSEYWRTMQINANENSSAVRVFAERAGSHFQGDDFRGCYPI